MDMMKAVAVVKDGLADVKVPRPQPGERDLLVRVQAVAVNPVDTIQQPAETGQAFEPHAGHGCAASRAVSAGGLD